MVFMNTPPEVSASLELYLRIVLPGMLMTFLYNYFAAVLRSTGSSVIPLVFLVVSTVMNILLDIVSVAVLHMGIAGAAWSTLIAQCVSAAGITCYCLLRTRHLLPGRRELKPDISLMKRIASVSLLTSLQQSIMNFGILMIQSLVNSFGVSVMAAFAAGVKIDSFAYGPAQDFANGYATFLSQNAGARNRERIRSGMKNAFAISILFCGAVSALIWLFAEPLMTLFIDAAEV